MPRASRSVASRCANPVWTTSSLISLVTKQKTFPAKSQSPPVEEAVERRRHEHTPHFSVVALFVSLGRERRTHDVTAKPVGRGANSGRPRVHGSPAHHVRYSLSLR